jgi:hypothetical protein
MNQELKSFLFAILGGIVVVLGSYLLPHSSRLGGSTGLNSLNLTTSTADTYLLAANGTTFVDMSVGLRVASATISGLTTLTGASTITGDSTQTSSTITNLVVGTSTQLTQIRCTSVLFDPPSLTPGQSIGQDITLSGVNPSSSQIIWASFTTNASTSYLFAVGSASSSNVMNVVMTLPTSTILGANAKNVQQGTINGCVVSYTL